MSNEPLKLFEWESHSDQLAHLFESAGLVELAAEVRDHRAHCSDIQRVLIELLLHRRVPYLPVLPVPEMDLDALYSGSALTVPTPQALRDFIEALPTGIVFHRVAHCGDKPGHEPGLIACVITETVFCQLEATFTLIPVPRPVDASAFLAP